METIYWILIAIIVIVIIIVVYYFVSSKTPQPVQNQPVQNQSQTKNVGGSDQNVAQQVIELKEYIEQMENEHATAINRLTENYMKQQKQPKMNGNSSKVEEHQTEEIPPKKFDLKAFTNKVKPDE